MYDSKKPAHRAALKAEIVSDPAGMGYDTSGPTAEVLRLLNDPDANVAGDSVTRPIEELGIPEIAGAIDSAEYEALSVYDQAWVRMFIARDPGVMLRPYQQRFMTIFPGGTSTRAAIIALRERPGSRAEALFGVNTLIEREGLFAARDS